MPARDGSYPPLDQLKPVASDLWIVDGASVRALGMRLPIRMTVIRLDAGVLLHSPTHYSDQLRDRIAAIGPIRHLVAPSFAHWTFLSAWQAALPDALTWAAPGLRERRQVRRSGVRLDRDLGDAPPPDWADQLMQCVIPGGGGFREVEFLHSPSRTALLTDLVQNVEPGGLATPMRQVAGLLGMTAPDGRAPAYLRMLVRLRRHEAAAAASRVLAWSPERVIFAHGRWFERDGTAALRRSWRWLLP